MALEHLKSVVHERLTVGGLAVCWEWKGPKDAKGYGLLWDTPGKRSRRVHQVVYDIYIGEMPEGMQVDHLCRNKSCANPAHLEAVTPRENTLRGDGPTAQNARKTHCPQGHEYSEENTRITPAGWRMCLTCERERNHAAYLRRRALRDALGDEIPENMRGIMQDGC